MFNNLTYKQKLKGLGIFAVIMIFICFRLAFSATLNEYKLYKTQKENLTFQNSSPLNAKTISTKDKYISLTLDNYLLDTLDNTKNLLGIVSAYCDKNKIALKEYKPVGKKDYDSLHILTRLVTVEGAFIDCLRLNYQLETQNNCGRIGSVLYKSYINPKDKSTYLNCSIYLQNIIDYERKK